MPDANIDPGVNETIDSNDHYTHMEQTKTNASTDDSATANLPISKHAVLYRGIKVHACSLSSGTQLVCHFMNY